MPPIRGIFRTDEDALAVYAESAGVARLMPRGVAVPFDAQDVEVLVRWASAGRVPLIPRGSGSSMSGAAVGDGVVVDLSRLRTLEPIDLAWSRVWCEPGVVRREVEHAANAARLRFPSTRPAERLPRLAGWRRPMPPVLAACERGPCGAG